MSELPLEALRQLLILSEHVRDTDTADSLSAELARQVIQLVTAEAAHRRGEVRS